MAKKTASKAFTKGEVLYLAFPSSKGGEYLVAVAQNKLGMIVVGHVCPAINKSKHCWHIDEAARLYREWKWWEDLAEDKVAVIPVKKQIVYEENWMQIPVPGVPIDLNKLLEGEEYAS